MQALNFQMGLESRDQGLNLESRLESQDQDLNLQIEALISRYTIRELQSCTGSHNAGGMVEEVAAIAAIYRRS